MEAEIFRSAQQIQEVNNQLRIELETRKRAEETFQALVRSTVNAGEVFFRSLVLELAKSLRVRYAFIGCILPDNPGRVGTIALCVDGAIAENFEYDLADTPCADVLHKQTCFFPRNIQLLFPKDQLLADMDIDAFFGATLRGADGKPLGVVVVLHDRPMQKETDLVKNIMVLAAERTAVEIERLRSDGAMRETLAALDAIVDGVFIFDPRTLRFSYVNEGAVRQVGYSREELLRMTPLDIKPEFDEPQVRAMIAPLVSGAKSVHSFTTVLRRKDGVDVPVEINQQCVAVGTAQARLIAIVRDITERKRTEEEARRQRLLLEAANKELEAFAYSVSHDLRAPLRSIDGFSQALLEDCAGRLNEQGEDHLNRIRAASQRMGQLIDDLLSLSRSARGELRREPVDLSALALESADEVRKLWPDRQVELVVTPGLCAEGDPRLLRIVFDNLLGNAWKFTSKQERAVIEVSAMSHDGTKAYFVRDNGVGFDMAYAVKLFGAFQRLHGITEYPGTGIGLATVQRIVVRHGGRVWAEGLLGQGATVYFTLGGRSA
jgi:PAS domain S-box-containing protein